MMKIYNGRGHFWQWDTGQRLIVDYEHVCEVHFYNPYGDKALTVRTYDLDGQRVADVPNILLQTPERVKAWVYICIGDACTVREQYFDVWQRQRPDDYVYTETELKSYDDLEKRVDNLEKNGLPEKLIAEAVKKYLEANPVTNLPEITPESEGKYLRVKDNEATWCELEIPQQYGLVTYDQSRTITIT